MTDRSNELALRGADLRVTRPRLAVMAALVRHPHAETNTIIELVRRRHADVSHQAVYDVLAALTSAGLVRRIQPLGSVARYEARVGDNHHHVVCRRCGAVADVDCAVGETPCLDPLVDHGYLIDEAEVIYWGVCPACRQPERSEETSRSMKPSTREEPSVRPGR
jgi:Fur family ferric uptake transcriptional regulator